MTTDIPTLINIILAAVAIVSLWFNWRMVQEGRIQTGLLVNDEIRKAYLELTGEEPGPQMDLVLNEFERQGPPDYKERVRRIRELQRQSRLYRKDTGKGS